MAFQDFRTRLFLITPRVLPENFAERFASALSGGDIGCVLIDLEPEAIVQTDDLAPLVKAAQDKDVAVLVAGDTQLAGHLSADGVHVSSPKSLDRDDQDRLQKGGMIIGSAGINSRHLALETGERGFDYLFFGRTDRTQETDNHPKTETLSLWWAQMMAVPCVAFAGTGDEAFQTLARGGVEFIAVRDEVWEADDLAAKIAEFNTTLDTIARQRMAEVA
ncbi:MAG: thiamine phosphate synthase [Pseudomonadota bacterium]